jgi:hypothetical protein
LGGLQLGFQLGDGRQAPLEIGGEGFDQAGDVGGYPDRLGDVAQGILGDGLAAGLAQDNADAGLVVGMAEQVIYR